MSDSLDERYSEIHELRLKGVPWKDISATYEISQSAAVRYFKQWCLKNRIPYPVKPLVDPYLYNLRREGMTIKDIARLENIRPKVLKRKIWRIQQKLGLPPSYDRWRVRRDIYNLRKEGLTFREILEELGRTDKSLATVHRQYKEYCEHIGEDL